VSGSKYTARRSSAYATAPKHNRNYYILGIQSFANQDSGAALLKCSRRGDLLDYVAISEERLIRKKYPYTFPVHSIGYCMDRFGLKDPDEIDLLVTDYVHARRWFNSGPAYRVGEFDYLKLKFRMDPRKIRTIRHHEAHAAATYYTSGFDDAAILIVDGIGSELETTSYYRGTGSSIFLVENYAYRGIGGLYSAVTSQILGFGQGGEGKTMGLAPYGKAHRPVLALKGKLQGIENDYSDLMRRRPYSDVLTYTAPGRRIDPLKIPHRRRSDRGDSLNPYFSRVAYEVQAETERALTHLARDIKRRTGARNLCVAGGVGLNSVANKIMLDCAGFDDIHIFPACSDAGIPFGLALWGYYHFFPRSTKQRLRFRHAFTGRSYGESEVTSALERYAIPYRPTTLEEVARHIADGCIVGWFQGGSEYGPRALGHRSILADSRDPQIANVLNRKIKHREPWRPFAPATLLENASEYFALDGRPSPFMLLVARVRKPRVVPAVTHVDGTARVQTLTREDNGVFHDLVKTFGRITGVPCILNTSFNDAGEPIVETPQDAILGFIRSGMNYLVLDRFIIDNRRIRGRHELIRKMESARRLEIDDNYRRLRKRFFFGYDQEERDRFVAESNKIAEWHAAYEAKYRLERQVLAWYWNKTNVLVVGTADHTAALRRKIPYFNLLNVTGFSPFGSKHDLKAGESVPYKKVPLARVAGTGCDAILVSSHEYQPEIERALRHAGVGDKAFSIYTNAGRNLIEVLQDFPSVGS
jgi:carbamoyltransferase